MDVIRVLIADEIARIVADLEKLEPYGDAVQVCGVAHQPSAVIEEAWLRQPDVLLLHEHFAGLPTADLAAQLGSVSPATRVLLMTSDETSLAADSGTAGTLPNSAGGPELITAIRAAADVGAAPRPEPSMVVTSTRREIRAPRGRGMVLVAFSGKGGTGTSMVATNLAVTLADGVRGRALLVDSDLQFGDAAGMLHVEHHPLTIADLAPLGDDIEGAALEGILATGPGEVGLLRAPSGPEGAQTIATANLRSIVRTAARMRAFVVIDTPSHIDERVLEVFELADRVLLVTSYNLSAVRGTKATLLLLEALGIDPDRIEVILNHTRPRTGYRREDIEEILGRRVLADLPYDPRVDPSLDSGTPFVLAQPQAELARGLTALARLAAIPDSATVGDPVEAPAPAPPVYRRRFSLGRR